jgi:hypothetical protein
MPYTFLSALFNFSLGTIVGSEEQTSIIQKKNSDKLLTIITCFGHATLVPKVMASDRNTNNVA